MKDFLKKTDDKPFKPEVILIDAMNIVKIYYHGITLNDSKGNNTSVLYGVLKAISDMLEKYGDVRIIVLWDSFKSIRKELYPEYKANRKHVHDEVLGYFIKILKTALCYVGVAQVIYEGIEADDLAGYYCNLYKGNNILLYSRDSDWKQFLNKNVCIQQRLKIHTFDSASKELGYPVNNILLYKTLKGDRKDNVFGVYGFPKKLAVHICKHANKFEDLFIKSFYSSYKSLKTSISWYTKVLESFDKLKRTYNMKKFDLSLVKPEKLCYAPDSVDYESFKKLCNHFEIDYTNFFWRC